MTSGLSTSGRGDEGLQAMEAMRSQMASLRRDVETLQLQLQHERAERETFERLVRRRLRSAPAAEIPTSNAEHVLLDEDQMRNFDEVSALLDAANSTSNSVSTTSQHTPATTTPKDANPYLEDSLDNAHKLNFAGLADLSTDGANHAMNSNMAARVTTPYPQGVLPSLISKDYEQNSNGEDITSLINDAMAQNLRKRTFSNDFPLAQPQRVRGGSAADASQSFGFTPNPSIRQFPVLPLRMNTPATPNLIHWNGPPTPSSQLGERDILEKWGIRFSEKYTTISEVWNEYHRVGTKGVSIKSLEASFSTRWRANLKKNVKKKYSRRLIIIRAIETGMKRGKTLEECISILETFLTEAKKPVSHLYRKANLPTELT
ncbi:LADA_0B05424g1_1 [Lachancea dasiensis]|uniref:LADA_0B05424g1_1 n=1 Tax=Lachancea dasiensis TaxID=1072105 RepID=A0A1G4IT74_9SACH|nr:LADA_0B05424g1_1 [Lachancea dasiensis]